MRRLILLALVSSIGVASAKETTDTATASPATTKLKELTAQYVKTDQQVRAGQEHLLRLEGAITVLRALEAPTTATVAGKPAR